jgi:hypothetical protein
MPFAPYNHAANVLLLNSDRFSAFSSIQIYSVWSKSAFNNWVYLISFNKRDLDDFRFAPVTHEYLHSVLSLVAFSDFRLRFSNTVKKTVIEKISELRRNNFKH